MEAFAETAVSHLEAMTLQESKYFQSSNVGTKNPYRGTPPCTEFARNVNEAWRIQMCQWYFEVVDCFDFDRGVVSIAINYLDRVIAESLSKRTFTTNVELQLAAITTLYLAIKLHGEIEPRGENYVRKKLTIDAFVVLCKHQFDCAAIETMELSLLSLLDWHLNPPDTRTYVVCMLELMPRRDTYLREWRCIFDIARYIAELSLGHSDFCFQVRPSVLACAAILCAMNSLQKSGRTLPPIDVLEQLSHNIETATRLRLDMPVVTHTALRLMRLCPTIHVQDAVARPKPVSSDDEVAVAVDEMVVSEPRPLQRKKSPVCVGSFDENTFFVEAGHHKKQCYPD